jgi:hypothetical protein
MTVDPGGSDGFRLLKRLAARGARLVPSGGGRFRLISRGGRRGNRQPEDVSPDVMASLLARGLIAPSADDALEATEAGRALVRRGLVAEDDVAARQDRGTVVLNDAELGPITVTMNHDESPLAWLRRRKGRDGRPLIDAAEFAAGERLRADFTRGMLMPRVTANWSAAVAVGRRDGRGGVAELTEAAIGARRRVARALEAVGPEFDGLLVDFCCFLKGLEDIERERRWPARSGKVVVRMALDRLARHYGFGARASGPERSSELRHWGTEDFRPT